MMICGNLFKCQANLGSDENHFILCALSDCIHLSTARWLCASRMTTSATQSATPAQIVVLTSWWGVTFGSGMWCTVRSTPKRGTKVKQLLLNPLCPIANESAAPHFPSALDEECCLSAWSTTSSRSVIDFGMGCGSEHRSTIWHKMFFINHI